MSFNKCLMCHIYCYSIIKNSFTRFKISSASFLQASYQASIKPLANTDLFTASIVLLFSECHIIKISAFLEFSGWFLLLNMHLRFIYLMAWQFFFFFVIKQHFIVWMNNCLFIHSVREGYVVCNQFLMNKAAVNIHVQVLMRTLSFQINSINMETTITRLCSKAIFSFVRNC